MQKATMFKIAKHTSLGLALATLAGCALCASNPEQEPSMQDVQWAVSQIDGDALVEGSEVTVKFDSEGRVSGRASCNGYSGEYVQTDTALEISRLIQTKRLCRPASLMQQEQRFTALLQQVIRWEVDDQGYLQLHTQDGGVLTAKAKM